MVEFKSVLVYAIFGLPMVYSWCFNVYSEHDFDGHNHAYSNTTGPSDCINLPRTLSGSVKSLVFKPAAIFCNYELYDEIDCKGSKNVSSGGNVRLSHVPHSVSDAKSFRVIGGGCHRTLPKHISCDP